jgi:DNA-directed RNA polymerase subunit RPC12/RpoP
MAADATSGEAQVATCPHCGKQFRAELLEGDAERHRGFKCPHCKLFVPESRAEDSPLTRDSD